MSLLRKSHLLLFICCLTCSTVFAEQADKKADAAPAGFDLSSGIWFPPYASSETYVSGSDPRHSYSKDLKDAFDSDAALRSAVCRYAAQHVVQFSESTPPRIRQLRSIFDMSCIAASVARTKEKEERHQAEAVASEVTIAMDLDHVAQLGSEERRRTRKELELQAERTGGCDSFQIHLKLLALSPEDDLAMYRVIQGAGCAKAGPEKAIAYLKSLLEQKSLEDSTGGSPWKIGLRNLLYYTRQFEQARNMTAEVLAFPSALNRPRHEKIFLLILDGILGDRQSLAKLDCPKLRPSTDPEEPEEEGCIAIARALSQRSIQTFRNFTPSAINETLVETIHLDPDNWPERMDSIRALELTDSDKAEQEAQKVLDLHKSAPIGARLDAMNLLSRVAEDRGEFQTGVQLLDQWLMEEQTKLTPLPSDAWSRVAAMPEFTKATLARCAPNQPAGVLGRKLEIQLKMRDFNSAKTSAEFYFARTLDDPCVAGYVRRFLFDLAQAEVRSGLTEEPLRILAYLAPQPQEPSIRDGIQELLRQLTPKDASPLPLAAVDSPWQK